MWVRKRYEGIRLGVEERTPHKTKYACASINIEDTHWTLESGATEGSDGVCGMVRTTWTPDVLFKHWKESQQRLLRVE